MKEFRTGLELHPSTHGITSGYYYDRPLGKTAQHSNRGIHGRQWASSNPRTQGLTYLVFSIRKVSCINKAAISLSYLTSDTSDPPARSYFLPRREASLFGRLSAHRLHCSRIFFVPIMTVVCSILWKAADLSWIDSDIKLITHICGRSHHFFSNDRKENTMTLKSTAAQINSSNNK